MEYLPVAELIRELDRQVKRILAMSDIQAAGHDERKIIDNLRLNLNFASRAITDFDLADSREHQHAAARQAVTYLKKVEQAILQASSFGYFGATDVADTTAQADRLMAYLRKV